jgi:dsDNA-specific endonuclease/ATPase MutS2
MEKKIMEIKSAIAEAIKELIIPELNGMKSDIQGLKSGLEAITKRLDDQNDHLIELSRRTDQVRTELSGKIDQVRTELSGKIDHVRNELNERIDSSNDRTDAINGRIDRLYEVVVKREEHIELRQLYRNIDDRVQKLEKALGKVKTAKMEYESV